jgi:DNA-binding NtrC family response regulator
LPAEILRPTTFALGDTIPMTIGMTVEEVERRLILATLGHCTGNKRQIAKTLGISLKTLYNRILEYRAQEFGARKE